MSRNRLVAVTFVVFTVFSATTPLLADDGTGAALVAVAFATKQACDQAVPGFSEKTNAPFESFKAEEADLIARLNKTKISGQSLEEFVDATSKHFLQKPRKELEKACRDFAKSLGVASEIQ